TIDDRRVQTILLVPVQYLRKHTSASGPMNMADHSSGSRTFMQVYNSLPPEARESLVEKQLSTLLDSAPQKSYDKVLRAATTLKTKYAAAPTLDLKRKQKEINGLIDELVRDSKRAIVCERSHRDELLSEIVESIVGWLNGIWSVVYEYNVHFQEAHRCLVYLSEVLDALNDAPGTVGQCKCPLAFNALQVTIRKKGKTIKTFSLQGPRNLDRVLLWIWRDLFVSMFAKDIHTDRIPDMLRDIEECMNWKALERLLYGGAAARSLFREDADDDDDDFDDDNDQVCQDDDNDGGEGEDDEPSRGSWRCRCKYHANHWNKHANDQRNELRDLVTEHLQNLFELAPSLKLFTSIVAISPDRELTEMDLFDTISNIAGASADALVAALEIHGSQGQAADLMSLLEEHAHLLRPRDASVYQAAVAVLSEFHGYHEQALELAEKELLDAAAGVRMGIKTAFSQIDDPTSVAALSEILKLRPDHLTRSQRVETWVEKALTPGSQPANPMAFAAMVMGFPFAGSFDESDDAEVLGNSGLGCGIASRDGPVSSAT
ncbi:unnamed protein product, partial [Mycena citricolor]